MNSACSSRSLSADSVLPGLIDEITERLNRGESVDIEAYVARYPDLAPPLLRVYRTLSTLREPLPASAGLCHEASDVLVPGRLGDFRIAREIGRGGMGIVYEAEQISLARKVALKVLPLAGLLDKKQLSRFRNEAHAAATLHHPHIVPVYAVGEDHGVHFYAMQLVEGKSLAEVVAQMQSADCGVRNEQPESQTKAFASLSTARSTRPAEYFRSVARLAAEVADALHYAHEMGVVHRDVKPSNLLLDGDGQVWVTDFGLASVDGSCPGLTMSGDLVGTLRYMSPEQAGGRRELTDHRTDVYSLGVTLYELVTLQPAYAGEERGRLLQQILYTGPRLPRQIDRHIPRDLETIILKAIDKQRSARYATAGELAADLRRFVAQRPIQARRASRLRRTWQLARRNPVAALLAALAACLVLGFAIAGPIVAVRERRLNSKLELQQYVSSIGLAASELQLGRTQRAFDILSRYQDSDLRGFEWHLLRAQSARHRTARGLRPGPPAWKKGGTIRDVAYSPDGSLLAAAHWSNNVKLWDVFRGTVVHPLKMPGKPRAVAFSSDGAYVAAGSELAQLHIWDVRDGSLLQTEDLHRFVPTSGGSPWRAVHGVAFAPDRASVAVVVGQGDSTMIEAPDVGGALVTWGRSAKTPTEPFQVELHVPLATAASAVAFNSDGSRVIVGCSDGGVICLSTADGSVLFRTAAHDLPIRGLAVSPDGAHFVTASCDQTIKLFRSRDGSHVRTLFGHTKEVHDVAFSPDGRHIASASFDSSIRLWDAETGEQVAALWGHASPAWCVAFAPDGRTCASGAVEGRCGFGTSSKRPSSDPKSSSSMPARGDWPFRRTAGSWRRAANRARSGSATRRPPKPRRSCRPASWAETLSHFRRTGK